MKLFQKLILVLTVVAITGCASGLNSMQKREYAAFEAEGVLIEEKQPGVGAAMGILPGFGSFYVGEVGYGILNLLLWPVSVLWDPVSGYDGAMAINYDLTKSTLKKKKEKELGALEENLVLGNIDKQQYVLAKRQIEDKYEY